MDFYFEKGLTAHERLVFDWKKNPHVSCNVGQIYPEETKTFSGWNKFLKNERHMSA